MNPVRKLELTFLLKLTRSALILYWCSNDILENQRPVIETIPQLPCNLKIKNKNTVIHPVFSVVKINVINVNKNTIIPLCQ